MGQTFNVRQAPAASFDQFICDLAEVNEQNVDRNVWPIHHRWRAINTCLEAGLLTLSEVGDGYQIQLPPEGKPEEVSSEAEEKPSTGSLEEVSA